MSQKGHRLSFSITISNESATPFEVAGFSIVGAGIGYGFDLVTGNIMFNTGSQPASEDNEKFCPNPYGSKGKEDHQKKIDE